MDEKETTKIDYCYKCKNYYTINLLVKSSRKRGYRRLCKSCQSIIYKEYVKKNKEELNRKKRLFYEKHIKNNLQEYTKKVADRNPIRYKARILKNSIISHCKKSNIEYDPKINIDYIENLLVQTPKCECCQKAFSYDLIFNHRNYDAPSIDRFDSKRGYTEDNISVICWKCNHVKHDATVDELEIIINWMKSKL